MIRFLSFLSAMYLLGVATIAARGDEVRIGVAPSLPPASALALTELRKALVARGDKPVDAAGSDALPMILVGMPSESTAVGAMLAQANRLLPEKPEAAAIVDVPTESKVKLIVIAGHDDRGLCYALRDAARAVAVTPREKKWWEGLTFAVEQPFLKVRNVSLHPCNADCEREWFFSEEFWRFYFAQLSLSRFNRCTLTFSDQSNYLCPMYPSFVAMPEFPDVKVEGLTVAEREKNLAMLRRIAELADEYAIDFDLGIWMQAPVPKYSAAVRVSGLPEGLKSADYCALGMRRVLEACPSIDGVQLRMNEEAGVKAEEQTEFYRPIFKAMAATGRPLRLELRYKGLQPATIDAAIAEKLDVTVSTKFWSEHFGLPYHPTITDSHYAADRYGYGTLLKKPRRYRVTYQLWNVGSQRLTLWGDPAYCAEFAKSCTLSGGEGFEVFAPLTNKGYGDTPGAWPVIKNPDYRVGRWEQERYWMFYLCFGRMGYDPATLPEIWEREFRHRFGRQAEGVEKAYAAASQVLPLITTALLPGASEWSWWPEMDTGGSLREYSHIQPSDPGQFAAIRRWERTRSWRWEPWDAQDGYVEEVLAGRSSGRITPLELSAQLKSAADAVRRNASLSADAETYDSAEQRMTRADFAILASLADYHSEKLLAAVDWAFYEKTKDQQRLVTARAFMESALRAWKELAAAGDVYHENLVFGITADSSRSRFGHHHLGHWRDRLPEIEGDLRALKRLTDEASTKEVKSLDYGLTPEPIPLQHTPPTSWSPQTSLTLTCEPVGPTAKLRKILVQVRPLNQTRPWQTLEMQVAGKGFSVTLPAATLDPNFDLQYRFQIVDAENISQLWPRTQWSQPYFVVPVETK